LKAVAPRAGAPRLGLRANLAQFALLVGVNALVGGMIGQERTVLPLLATNVFGLTAVSAVLTFIVAFGLTKAVTNLVAGTLSDRLGRKPVLTAGWLVGVPVPLLLIWAPSWGWVILANVLLGVNQGLTWSTTVNMKIDLVGPQRRGLAMGLNEASGYGGLSTVGYGRSRSFWASPTPGSDSLCQSCWCARHRPTLEWSTKRGSGLAHSRRPGCARSSSPRASGSRRSRPAAPPA